MCLYKLQKLHHYIKLHENTFSYQADLSIVYLVSLLIDYVLHLWFLTSCYFSAKMQSPCHRSDQMLYGFSSTLPFKLGTLKIIQHLILKRLQRGRNTNLWFLPSLDSLGNPYLLSSLLSVHEQLICSLKLDESTFCCLLFFSPFTIIQYREKMKFMQQINKKQKKTLW